MQVYYLNETNSPAPYGFNNTGVICYWNSLMQCLLSCTSIAEYLKSTAITSLTQQYIKAAEEKDPNISAIILNNVISLLRQRFGGSQESASEGYILLASLLPINYLITHRHLRTIKCGACDKVGDILKETSIHFEMFGSEAESIKNTEDFVRFIKNRRIPVSDYKCEYCGACSKNSIQYEKLEMLPEIIVLIYNKYSPEAKSKTLFIPAEFTISKLHYTQVGQIRHSGNLNSGHYWAVIKRNNKIYVANDNNISGGIVGDLTPDPQTYMVFYHIKNG